MPTKPPALTTGLRIAVLALAAALLAAVMTALACAPAAPSSQQRTPTPEPSATAKPADTPAPTPTATPQPDTDKLSPELSAILDLHHAQGQSAYAASAANPLLPDNITLHISTKRNFNEPIKNFLEDNGAMVTHAEEGPSGMTYGSYIAASAPLSLVPALSRQPGFSYAFAEYSRYEKISDEFSNLLMLHETGRITIEEAAQQTQAYRGFDDMVALDVYIDSCNIIPRLDGFIEQRTGITQRLNIDTCIRAAKEPTGPVVYLSAPLSIIVELSLQPGVKYIGPENLDQPMHPEQPSSRKGEPDPSKAVAQPQQTPRTAGAAGG